MSKTSRGRRCRRTRISRFLIVGSSRQKRRDAVKLRVASCRTANEIDGRSKLGLLEFWRDVRVPEKVRKRWWRLQVERDKLAARVRSVTVRERRGRQPRGLREDDARKVWARNPTSRTEMEAGKEGFSFENT